MGEIGRLIARVVQDAGDEKVLAQVRRQVQELASAFPVPGIPA
jgi:glycine/serine hydroxymethyltransferase